MATGSYTQENSGNWEISNFSEQYWKWVVTQHYAFTWKLEFSWLSVHCFPDRDLKFGCWSFLWGREAENLGKTVLEQWREPAKNFKEKTVTSDSWIEPRPQRSHHCLVHAPYLLSAHHIALLGRVISRISSKTRSILTTKCFLALKDFFPVLQLTLNFKRAHSSCIMWHKLCGQTVPILWTV